MERFPWLGSLLLIPGLACSVAAGDPSESAKPANKAVSPADASADGKVRKTPAEWRKLLTLHQYEITRLRGTERAFTGAYRHHKEPGIYRCICCGADLFSSEHKF